MYEIWKWKDFNLKDGKKKVNALKDKSFNRND